MTQMTGVMSLANMSNGGATITDTRLAFCMAERIRAGDMTLGAGDAAVTMDMPAVFRTTMEVTDSRKRAGIERELELEITWTVDEEGNPVDKPGPVAGFAIS